MKTLTIFTPTYNRGYCLGRLYESLARQSDRDFIWLVIDDGSTDDTKNLVENWQRGGLVEIQYVYKENGGMHSAHNAAYAQICTELNMCIDSDDYLPGDAVLKLLAFWKENKRANWAGVLALDAFTDGRIVGTTFPIGMAECKYSQLKSRYGVVGDKKFVYRTDVIRKYPPYPIFPGEKFVPLGYLYMLIDQDYDLGVLHEVLCIVEYMPDGSSRNIFRSYRRNPAGFAHERKQRMLYADTFKERFTNAAHYVSSALFLKNRRFLAESTNKPMTLLAVPLGILLHLYIRKTSRGGVMK
jgi:glycosyltransferase involved in cell wall biosynthesis